MAKRNKNTETQTTAVSTALPAPKYKRAKKEKPALQVPSPKDGAKRAIALCHNLIATADYNVARFEEVKAALAYLETLFKQVEESDAPAQVVQNV